MTSDSLFVCVTV